jgi:hypothetical protein
MYVVFTFWMGMQLREVKYLSRVPQKPVWSPERGHSPSVSQQQA